MKSFILTGILLVATFAQAEERMFSKYRFPSERTSIWCTIFPDHIQISRTIKFDDGEISSNLERHPFVLKGTELLKVQALMEDGRSGNFKWADTVMTDDRQSQVYLSGGGYMLEIIHPPKNGKVGRYYSRGGDAAAQLLEFVNLYCDPYLY